ncbi:MAG: hypothetical protein KF715_00785 [Candidatus Didemnitutus sp.]|nr:hypothetical protein [Candidatus Didemnitutus sp.]
MRVLLIFVLLSAPLCAQDVTIPAEELARPPSATRLDALVATAARDGWGRLAPGLRAAALAAYEREPASAGPWLLLYRWGELFGTPRRQALENWIKAIETAGGAHANMPLHYALPPGSLGGELKPELQRWLVGNAAFSQEFFATLSDQDNPIEVLAILQKIESANPGVFADYASLALAIAVVYDVPPPPDWPHGQVSATMLPRRLPEPTAAFDYWTKLDRANVAAHKLKRLPASELKFVVDTSTPFSELIWARQNVTPTLSELARAYDMIRYRKERVANNQFTWPGRDYSLQSILRDGGICVDQAYFAANVGKARGVPTLLFRGAGLDGRHAWFGFLSPTGWVMDAGRYAEQKFVTGLVRDPQTWRELTDHELAFISERFRQLPLFQLSELHASFALEFLRANNPAAALRAAREAVNRESRNLRGWQTLLSVQKVAGTDAREREGTLREAMRAFARYPDLESSFGRQLVASLRERGEGSLANVEEQRLARKYETIRSDLSYQQAGEILQRSLQSDDLATQFRTYQRLLETYGNGANIDFFDKIVRPFVESLRRRGEIASAMNAVDRARRTLRIPKGSQLEGELNQMAAELRQPR